MNRFSIVGMESAYWEGYELGDNSNGRVPGPASYELMGFITLSSESAEHYWNDYEWEEVTPEFLAKYLDFSEYEGKNWYYCKAVKDEICPQYYIMSDFAFDGETFWFSMMYD